jgi:ABC-type uncharacterized transport system involved in gliding motility auxiliary subunit
VNGERNDIPTRVRLLEQKVAAHERECNTLQDRLVHSFEKNDKDHETIGDNVSRVELGIGGINSTLKTLGWVLVPLIGFVTGLLVYIFRTHTH